MPETSTAGEYFVQDKIIQLYKAEAIFPTLYRKWSFKTKQWIVLGETEFFHFLCGSTILNDRLYMFSGLTAPAWPGNANHYVESYDLIKGTFHRHADTSSKQDMFFVEVVALPHVSKVYKQIAIFPQ